MIFASAAMTGSYDYGEVARSVLVAIAASYAALDLTGRVTAARGGIRLAWLSGGAIAMGIGIWAMHIKGMLAFQLPVPIKYHWPTILAALLVAIFASAVALYVASRQKMGWREAWTGSVIMGAGIAGLHYIAMAAMRLPAITRYSSLLVTASLLLAVFFSLIALLMAFDLREEKRWTVPRRLGSALVMGAAVSAMHYTGMAAASFIPAASPDLTHAVSISAVGNNAIGIVTLIVLAAAMVTSSVDRRASVEVERINEELERRVLERTSQLTAANEALAETEERFRRLVEALPDALFVVSQDQVVFVNPSAVRLLGAQRSEQIVGKQLSDIIHPNSLASIRRRMRDSSSTGIAAPPMEHVLLALDGSPVETESASIPILWRGSPATEAIVRDTRERKRAEARLQEYEKAVEGLEEMIVVVDRNYRYVLANRAFLNCRGMEREQLVGHLISEVLNPGVFETVVKEKLDECFQGKVLTYELTYNYPHLGPRDLFISYFPIEGPNGIDRVACVLQDITERRRAEEALRESEDRYRDLVEHSHDLLCTHDLEGNLLSCNPAPARILGYEVTELVKIPMRELIAPEFREQFDQYLTRIKTNGEDKGVMTVVTRTGERRIWEYHNTLRTEGVPSPIVRGMARDITDRKRAETALRRSEENYRMFVAQSSEGIFRQDVDAPIPIDLPEDELVYRILHDSYLAECNDAIARMYGLNSAQDFIGKRLIETVDPTDPHNIELTREYIRSGFRVLERESHEVDIHGNPKIFLNSMIGIVEDGKLVRTWGIQRDITERKRAEEVLRASERAQFEIAKQLETERARLIEAQAVAKVGSWEIELPSLAITWSEQTHQIFETDPGYFHPTRSGFVEHVHPEDRAKVDAAFEASLQKGAPSMVEYRIVMADGRVKVLEERWKVFHDGGGRPARLVGTCQDITERKQAEQALQESQAALARVIRIATMGELTASIAHEINQPLAAVATNASASLRWLASQPPNLDEARQAMANAMNEANRASGVIKRLRTLLQKTPPQLQAVNVNEIIRDVLALVHRELISDGVATRTELAPDLPTVLGDRVQLQQVVLNLIMNAIEAMSTVVDRSRTLLIRSAKDGDAVVIQVQDSGTGLKPEEMDRIFEPFFTTKPQGIGMGLSIGRSIVEAHGGRLWFTLAGSHGTVFQFTLPAQKASDDERAA
jgi:PAS domain S-box-containing protein